LVFSHHCIVVLYTAETVGFIANSILERRKEMSFKILAENTIIKCKNPTCRGTFSVIVYTFSDLKCTVIDSGKIIPFTGNTPYFCPCCGEDLRRQSEVSK
jgi:hypothetical protein